jgi:hypothetical protein
VNDHPARPLPSASRIKAKPILVFLAVTLLPFGVASAVAEKCINEDDPCNPALLCSFEADLAGKVATYQAYLRNSQVTRNAKSKKREGVTYQGNLYDAALAEAAAKHPDATIAVQRRVAADIFNDKLRASLKDRLPKFMECGIPDVTADDSILATWNGMHTSEDCNVYGDTDDGAVLLDDLKEDTTACLEFFERDVGHEGIHKSLCNERRGKPPAEDPYDIDQAIEEEVAAYNYSVKRAAADVRTLALKCSVDPSLKTRRKRAAALSKKLSSYQAKGR